MAKTLLNGVNEILTRVGVISGDSGALSSLTDSARQRPIDVAVQVINEGMDELYSLPGMNYPQGQAESTITLVTGTRSYSLATDLVTLHFPMIDKTNNQYIFPFPGGYADLIVWDPEQDNTGQPHYAAINPTDGTLFLDATATANDNGNVYTYQYDKDVSMSVLTDTVPFSDAVFRAMVPAWVQLWKREMRNEFDMPLFEASMGRAARLANQMEACTSYNPRG